MTMTGRSWLCGSLFAVLGHLPPQGAVLAEGQAPPALKLEFNPHATAACSITSTAV
jgi:hypothetical protein